jgi:polyketide biosynthesis enoyl-CoA hydratase PksH
VGVMSYQTIRVRFQEPICFIGLHRPDRNNTINNQLIDECRLVLAVCEESVTTVVLEGSPEVFCLGADFQELRETNAGVEPVEHGSEALYNLWLSLATGPYMSVAHVRGKANAGGVGMAAACDIVIADESAQFSLSELLFGLMPACVLPFLIRRVGFQRAHYMTLTTRPIPVGEAHAWGLVDAFDKESGSLLRKHLLRLRRISKASVRRYKRYVSELDDSLRRHMPAAIFANHEMFSDTGNLEAISRYVETGLFPWEQ